MVESLSDDGNARQPDGAEPAEVTGHTAGLCAQSPGIARKIRGFEDAIEPA
jgi:hypothetical protein